jgi:hypothetical protein
MSNAHDFLTRKVLDALPHWQRELWAPGREKLIAEYCWYPDWFFSVNRNEQLAARPYVILVDGAPFHYLPANPVGANWHVEEDGTLRRLPNGPNAHWIFVSRGFHDSLETVIDHLRTGRIEEAARFAGSLLHVVEDAGSAIHSLEGVDGTDPFVLDRLLQPPSGRMADMPGFVLRQDDAVDFDWETFRPTLLGTTIDETVFRLYSSFCAMVRANRFELVPMVHDLWRGENESARTRISRTNRRMCGVAADLLSTLTCIACDRFEAGDRKRLERVGLEELEPIDRPYILPGYEATPLVVDHNLDEQKRKVPLRLAMPDGVRTFEHGIGTGCHVEVLVAYDLPKDVYEHLRGSIGLHTELGRQGAFAAEIRLAGRTILEDHFDAEHPAAEFDLPVRDGGMLELFVRDRTGDWGTPHNHIVWGEPHLVRRGMER